MSIDFSKRKFLIIDDFEKFLEVLSGMLQEFDAQDIDLAVSGSDAMFKIKNREYDVIMCDYYLRSGKNGQQILEQIQHENLLKRSAVFIMITGEGNPEVVMSTLECDPDGYMLKPFNQAMLKTRLTQIISKKMNLLPIYNALDEKDYPTAIDACNSISKKYPKYALHCDRLRAQTYLDQKKYNEAKTLYENIVQSRDVPWANLGLAICYYHLEEYAQGIENLRKLINTNKTYVQAYDWLAKTLRKLKEDEQAKHVLQTAVKISPLAILRQMDLGKVAYDVKDMAIAAKAYREAVKLGRNSCFKSVDNYMFLARALMEIVPDSDGDLKKTAEEALAMLKEARTDYRKNKKIELEAHILESKIYTKIDRVDEAKHALSSACNVYENIEHELSEDVKLSMAKTLSEQGKDKQSQNIAKQIAEENPESNELNEAVSSLIEDSPLNSKGVALYREGKYKEAIDIFQDAVAQYPSSLSINLNAIQTLLKYINEDEDAKKITLLERCGTYFENIKTINLTDKRYARYQELQKMYNEMTSDDK